VIARAPSDRNIPMKQSILLGLAGFLATVVAIAGSCPAMAA
jgi:hypothetical protein